MGGTNNLLKTGSADLTLEDLKEGILSLLEVSLHKTYIVYICSLPPIPAVGYSGKKFVIWKALNKFIKSLDGTYDGRVKLIQVDKVFFNWANRTIKQEKFESSYPNGRQDRVHWNERGMSDVLSLFESCL